MTITIERDALLAAVQQVAGVVPSRVTIPVLANLLIECDGGALRITGTDLDLVLAADADTIACDGPMVITVGAAKLLAAAQSFKPGAVTMKLDAGKPLALRQGRGVRSLPTLPATDFPRWAVEPDATRFSMAARSLSRLMEAAAVAMARDESRPYYNGIYLHTDGTRLVVAATDGNCLVAAQTDKPEGLSALSGVIVPSKMVAALRKALAKSDTEIQIAISERRISVVHGTSSMASKLVDYSYPNYRRVIPDELGQHVITLARDALIDPVNAVKAVVNAEGDDRVRKVVFDLGDADDAHEVSARDSLNTTASEPVDAVVEGGAFRFAVNSHYLATIAGIFSESGRLTVGMAAHDKPIKITSDKDPDLVAIVMPMKA